MAHVDEPKPNRAFTAVVLAGGRSRRMGQDKARLRWNGLSLIERQLDLLDELAAEEIFIAARSSKDYVEYGVPVLVDAFPGQGPLAGLERALQASRHPLLLALAVDLPGMTVKLLSQLLTACTKGRGVVPRLRGELEPLAACYPKTAYGWVVECLDSHQNSARDFAIGCVDRGWVNVVDVPEDAACQFVNWNRPDDVTGCSVDR